MNLTNYHSHCSFCDGKAPMEDFVRQAVEAGFTSYGFSSHAPLPFETRWTLSSGQMEAYLEEIRRLQAKYSGEIELYAGLEIDYLNASQHPGIPYFQHLPLDYRIGSVHLIYTPAGEIIDTDTRPENFRHLLKEHFQGDLRQMVRLYWEASMQMVEQGGFDIVGHADKITYNAGLCDPDLPEQEGFRQEWMEYFSYIAQKGLMLEINTKAYLTKGCFFPHLRYFKEIRKLGIPVVVNSDAHLPGLINAGRREALESLMAAGFRTVRELHGGQWVEKEITL